MRIGMTVNGGAQEHDVEARTLLVHYLREDCGLDIPESVEIRVWDSSAELRYFVVPQRPAGTEDLDEEQLAELVTRDSLIGVGQPLHPGASR